MYFNCLDLNLPPCLICSNPYSLSDCQIIFFSKMISMMNKNEKLIKSFLIDAITNPRKASILKMDQLIYLREAIKNDKNILDMFEKYMLLK